MPHDRPDAAAGGEDPTAEATREPAARSPWRPFVTPERVEQTGSTNADLLEAARAGAPEGTAIVAHRQSAGRGRLGRRWLDHPGGSLLCSVLFRPAWPMDEWFLASWVVSLAAADAARALAGVECRCKWPNDLLAGAEERKVAGVLAEVADPGGLVVGIGVNCNWPAEFPPPGEPEAAEIAARATSLDRLAGRPVDPARLGDEMLAGVAARWAALTAGAAGHPEPAAAAALRAEYRRRSATIGEPVRADLPGGEVSGLAVGVDDGGRLLVESGGTVVTIEAGDVVHLRPGDRRPA